MSVSTCRLSWPQARSKEYDPRLIYSVNSGLQGDRSGLTQEHVLGKDIHAIDTLWSETVGQRMIAMEILLQRASKNGTETIGRESTRKHRDVAKATLQGFV